MHLLIQNSNFFIYDQASGKKCILSRSVVNYLQLSQMKWYRVKFFKILDIKVGQENCISPKWPLYLRAWLEILKAETSTFVESVLATCFASHTDLKTTKVRPMLLLDETINEPNCNWVDSSKP